MAASLNLETQLIENHLTDMNHELRLNILTQRVEDCGIPLDDYAESTIHNEMRAVGIRNMGHVDDVIKEVAGRNRYNPVYNYLENWIETPWDGHDWISEVASFVTEDVDPDQGEHPVFPLYLRKWMVGAAAKVLRQDGCRNPMLVLDGPQDIGKSMFVEWLCPKALYPRYFRDAQIDPDNQDHKIGRARTFIWEAAELDKTANAKDASRIKSFITEYHVTEREAWRHYPMELPTITSFIGTVNNVCGFLNDASGSSRFRICKLKAIDYDGYTNARPDLIDLAWCQAVHLYLAGETRDLPEADKKYAMEVNARYSIINNTKIALEAYFDIDPDSDIFTASETIREVLQRQGLAGPDTDARRIANCMKEMGLRNGWKKINGTNRRGYFGISKKLDVSI